MLRRLFFAVSLLFLGSTVEAAAQSVLEHLVSPGALSARHLKLEANCAACHAPFDKSRQTQLCAGCHKDVRADIAGRKGFHGRRALNSSCASCHTEHKGRSGAITVFNRQTFDHGLTDYPLRGAHRSVACQSCHRGNARFRAAPATCVGCHGAKDPHRGTLGPRCESCHDESSWKRTRFDHDSTRFALTGAHSRTSCASCHANNRFKGTPTDCASCHRDVHAGRLGPGCGACHGTASWTAARFDHSRSGFALTGRHAAITCGACHISPATKVKLPTQCVSCHRKDDVHAGKNGPACGQCHTAVSWKTAAFDHDRMTNFPLRGRHAQITCEGCHRKPPRQEKLNTTCIACHRKDDVHAAQLGESCGQCHGVVSWTANLTFDHDLVRFPLLGKHAQVKCDACHATRRFKDAAVACVDCHRSKDIHRGAFGAGCGQCHNPNAWAAWSFDHARTDFPLTGAHARVDCAGCHRPGQSKTATVCGECHRKDDVHQGSFGLSCNRCHTTETFIPGRSR